MNEMIICDTPDSIEHYRMCAIIASLKIEINTGMKMSRFSLVETAKQNYGTKGRTKKKVLEEMLEIYKAKYNKEYGD